MFDWLLECFGMEKRRTNLSAYYFSYLTYGIIISDEDKSKLKYNNVDKVVFRSMTSDESKDTSNDTSCSKKNVTLYYKSFGIYNTQHVIYANKMFIGGAYKEYADDKITINDMLKIESDATADIFKEFCISNNIEFVESNIDWRMLISQEQMFSC